MSKNLLIVESPKKARTIQKFLKGNWNVRASYGHIRQLARDGEDRLGFDLIGDEVRCRYVAISFAASQAGRQQSQKEFIRIKNISQTIITSIFGN